MASISQLLEKLGSKDKDFRYMAASDLLNELTNNTFKVDPDTEKRICDAVVKALDDTSGDISSLCVRCLGKLINKVTEPRAEEIVKQLCGTVLTGKKAEQRDIASISLKTIVGEVTVHSTAAKIGSTITTAVLQGIANQDAYEIASECLDIETELLAKFGSLLAGLHPRIRDSLLPPLDDSHLALRKRALHCLAALAVYLSDDLLDSTVVHLLQRLQNLAPRSEVARTYVQAVASVSRAVAYRFGKHLDAAVPLVLKYLSGASEGDDELREHCLQALESFMLKCPTEAKGQLPALLEAALKYVKYDPNFADDMEEDGGEEDEEEEDEDDIESDEGYSDDEDMSWKVRRAAAKCLSAAINNFPDHLPATYAKAGPELVGRFKEREESVKADVFAAYIALLRNLSAASRRDDSAPLMQQLASDAPAVVKACARQLKERSPKTKVGAFQVLRELLAALPSSAADNTTALLPGILHALNDKSSSSPLRIEALTFLRQLLAATPPDAFQAHVAPLAPAVFGCVSERYYKVAAEGLRACEQLIRALRPDLKQPVGAALAPQVAPMQACVVQRLTAQDQDQEVKETAISCAATLVACLGDTIQTEPVLQLLVERLKNDITRLAAVKAFATIAASPLPLSPPPALLDATLQLLSSFLRRANRPLRLASLGALDALADRYSSALGPETLAVFTEEAAALITDSDLSLTTLALKFAVTLLKRHPSAATAVIDKVLPQSMALVCSPLLQGAALDALQAFLAAAAASGAPAAALPTLLAHLMRVGAAPDAGGASKQAQHSVAQCVAALCVSAGAASTQQTVKDMLATLSSKKADPASHRLALLCLGEIGRRADLSSTPAVEAAITASLASDSDELKSAASLALGGVACGNLGAFMPQLLAHIQAAAGQAKQQYLLLQALNEVIASIAAAGTSKMDFSAGVLEQVQRLLLANCEGEEECRNVVAECLGRLALLHPAPLLATLRSLLASPSPHTRTVVATATKYTIVERPHPIDEPLRQLLPDVLGLMADEDRHVRKAAVVSLAAVAHHKAALLGGQLGTLLPMLYEQTRIREDMIRTVDLGPFKHKIDDGLELRKAAFECMDIMLEACPQAFPLEGFLPPLESGLRDHYDVKLPSHAMLASLASSAPAAVLAGLDRLVEPLDKTLTTRLKSEAVKQEADRHEDLLRSCLRAVDALARMAGVEGCAPFQQFMKRTVMGPNLKDKYAAVRKERVEAERGDAGDLAVVV